MQGTRIVYCSQSLSLAALEILVNFDLGNPPTGHVSVELHLPDHLAVEHAAGSFSDGAFSNGLFPAMRDTQEFGTSWLRERRSCVLSVPSIVVAEENNILLNPAHHDFKKVDVVAINEFQFDQRLRATSDQ